MALEKRCRWTRLVAMKCLEAILSLETGRTHATVFANGNALPGMWNIGKARVNGEAKIQVIITAPGGCP